MLSPDAPRAQLSLLWLGYRLSGSAVAHHFEHGYLLSGYAIASLGWIAIASGLRWESAPPAG